MPFVILPTNSASGGYEVTNSLRTNRASSDYLNKTFSGSGNRRTFTISFWLKISALASDSPYIFGASTSTTNAIAIYYNTTGQLSMEAYTGAWSLRLHTSALLRDPSAWYHICYSIDTTQATDTNRVKLYINGVQQTFSTSPTQVYPSLNLDLPYNQSGNSTTINCQSYYNAEFFSGYYSEFYMIDGQQLTPTSFGETDEDTGIWKPKAYTGTYGTNGFYLQFKNSASLGTDSSGNGNNWTVNNLTSVDQSTDTPTNNFATANPLEKEPPAYSNGNLTHGNGAVWRFAPSTIAVSSGKWYAEFKIGGGDSIVGIASVTDMANNTILVVGSTANSIGYDSSGSRGINNSFVAYGSSFTTNDIISIALDMNNNALYFAKNGTYQNSGVPTSGASKTGAINISTSDFYVLGMSQNNNTSNSNYGSPAYSANSYTDGAGLGNFSYSVPAGFYSLNTKNLAQFG